MGRVETLHGGSRLEAIGRLLVAREQATAGGHDQPAGNGGHRGGLGQVIEVAHAAGEPFIVSKMFDRIQHPARGMRGGGDGAAGRVYLKEGGEFQGKGRDVVPAGATLVMETPGGGGIGAVGDRDPEKVHADLAAGLISRDAARDQYGLKD